MSVQFMDEVLGYTIESFSEDYGFDYSFDGEVHVLESNENVAEVEAKIDGGVWITRAVVKDSNEITVGAFTDSIDEAEYDDIEEGRYESNMDNFFADDVLDYFSPVE